MTSNALQRHGLRWLAREAARRGIICGMTIEGHPQLILPDGRLCRVKVSTVQRDKKIIRYKTVKGTTRRYQYRYSTNLFNLHYRGRTVQPPDVYALIQYKPRRLWIVPGSVLAGRLTVEATVRKAGRKQRWRVLDPWVDRWDVLKPQRRRRTA